MDDNRDLKIPWTRPKTFGEISSQSIALFLISPWFLSSETNLWLVRTPLENDFALLVKRMCGFFIYSRSSSFFDSCFTIVLVSYPSTCKGMKAFKVVYRQLPYPHKRSPGYIQKHQVFVNTLLNAVGPVYSHGTLLYTLNLPFLQG